MTLNAAEGKVLFDAGPCPCVTNILGTMSPRKSGDPSTTRGLHFDFSRRSLLGDHRFCRRHGIDAQGESMDVTYYDTFSGGNGDGGDGVPKLAVDEDFAGGSQFGLRDTELADQATPAGDDLVAAGAHGDAHKECGNQSKGNSDGEGGQEVHAHFGNRSVDEQQAAQGQQQDSPGRQNAVTGEFGFGDEESEGDENHGQRSVADWQEVHGEGRQDNEDDSEGAGDDGTGMVEFHIQT